MKLSEELTWRGFVADNTFTNIKELDETTRKFYFGVDPSADSMTVGNLASLMMCSVFIRHGYTPFLLVGGATGQIGDPKDTSERDLKPEAEVERNKNAIAAQFHRIIGSDFTLVDNNDWFKDIKFIPFLREVGKQFSMTQLLDREFVRARIGEGGSGISYAEFSYSLIQGYDYLHLYREHGIDLQLCGADQFGNCTSGMHLVKRLENARVDVWSSPLIINQSTGRKFGKSEAGAIWLSNERTPILDFYQFWLNADDVGVENYLKVYTPLDKATVDDLMIRHSADPSARLAQKTLAFEVTKFVHGLDNATGAVETTAILFNNADASTFKDPELSLLSEFIPALSLGVSLVDALVDSKIATSKSDARKLIAGGAISINGNKVNEDATVNSPSIIKKGKNKFILVR